MGVMTRENGDSVCNITHNIDDDNAAAIKEIHGRKQIHGDRQEGEEDDGQVYPSFKTVPCEVKRSGSVSSRINGQFNKRTVLYHRNRELVTGSQRKDANDSPTAAESPLVGYMIARKQNMSKKSVVLSDDSSFFNRAARVFGSLATSVPSEKVSFHSGEQIYGGWIVAEKVVRKRSARDAGWFENDKQDDGIFNHGSRGMVKRMRMSMFGNNEEVFGNPLESAADSEEDSEEEDSKEEGEREGVDEEDDELFTGRTRRDRRMSVEGDDEEAHAIAEMVGLDASLDGEEEEDEFDRFAEGIITSSQGRTNNKKDIIRMAGGNWTASPNCRKKDSSGLWEAGEHLPGSLLELKDRRRDSRANHAEAAKRLLEDAEEASFVTGTSLPGISKLDDKGLVVTARSSALSNRKVDAFETRKETTQSKLAVNCEIDKQKNPIQGEGGKSAFSGEGGESHNRGSTENGTVCEGCQVSEKDFVSGLGFVSETDKSSEREGVESTCRRADEEKLGVASREEVSGHRIEPGREVRGQKSKSSGGEYCSPSTEDVKEEEAGEGRELACLDNGIDNLPLLAGNKQEMREERCGILKRGKTIHSLTDREGIIGESERRRSVRFAIPEGEGPGEEETQEKPQDFLRELGISSEEEEVEEGGTTCRTEKNEAIMGLDLNNMKFIDLRTLQRKAIRESQDGESNGKSFGTILEEDKNLIENESRKKHVPDHVQNPHKYTYYSLDWDEEDSDKVNEIAFRATQKSGEKSLLGTHNSGPLAKQEEGVKNKSEESNVGANCSRGKDVGGLGVDVKKVDSDVTADEERSEHQISFVPRGENRVDSIGGGPRGGRRVRGRGSRVTLGGSADLRALMANTHLGSPKTPSSSFLDEMIDFNEGQDDGSSLEGLSDVAGIHSNNSKGVLKTTGLNECSSGVVEEAKTNNTLRIVGGSRSEEEVMGNSEGLGLRKGSGRQGRKYRSRKCFEDEGLSEEHVTTRAVVS